MSKINLKGSFCLTKVVISSFTSARKLDCKSKIMTILHGSLHGRMSFIQTLCPRGSTVKPGCPHIPTRQQSSGTKGNQYRRQAKVFRWLSNKTSKAPNLLQLTIPKLMRGPSKVFLILNKNSHMLLIHLTWFTRRDGGSNPRHTQPEKHTTFAIRRKKS